jgi:uncharacterized protein YndB with AHSA1/START domain
MKSARHGQVEIQVDAPPESVWRVVADLDRMGEWSPECYRVRWLDGASSPAKAGARFKGWNRYGRMKWSMTCEVTSAEPGREVAWSTIERGRELVRWTYRFDPVDDGTRVTESFDCLWLPFKARLAEDLLMRDRDQRRRDSMRATLERIKAVAESEVRSTGD